MNESSINSIFNVSAALEIGTGIILIIAPEFTIHYLLGDGLTFMGVVVTRLAGIALISVGVSALEILGQPIKYSTRLGLLIYNLGTVIFFTMLATVGMVSGVLVWPTIGLHLTVSVLIIRALWK